MSWEESKFQAAFDSIADAVRGVEDKPDIDGALEAIFNAIEIRPAWSPLY